MTHPRRYKASYNLNDQYVKLFIRRAGGDEGEKKDQKGEWGDRKRFVAGVC